jgi:Phage late-transcription coactivator
MNELFEPHNHSEIFSDSSFFILDENTPQVSDKDKILFKNSTEFSVFITDLAQSNGDTITQTIIDYCEDRDLDPEDISKLVSKSLKERIMVEMQESGLMRKDSSASLE